MCWGLGGFPPLPRDPPAPRSPLPPLPPGRGDPRAAKLGLPQHGGVSPPKRPLPPPPRPPPAPSTPCPRHLRGDSGGGDPVPMLVMPVPAEEHHGWSPRPPSAGASSHPEFRAGGAGVTLCPPPAGPPAPLGRGRDPQPCPPLPLLPHTRSGSHSQPSPAPYPVPMPYTPQFVPLTPPPPPPAHGPVQRSPTPRHQPPHVALVPFLALSGQKSAGAFNV